MKPHDLIAETVRALRFNVGTDEMTDDMIAEEILKTLAESPLPGNGKTSDGFHTFDELYRYRALYNAMAFGMAESIIEMCGTRGTDLDLHLHKSTRHNDGELCFGGGWFIVMATIPGQGQISNHYPMKYWDLFAIPEVEVADEWDGHTPEQAAERLEKWLGLE